MASITPAALYRLVESEGATLLLDEAQSLGRRGSESSEVVRELFNAGIDRNAVVTRCAGKDYEPTDYAIYSPKVMALIGSVDGVLADRCLAIDMKRKKRTETVERYRSRVVDDKAEKLRRRLEKWASKHRKQIGKVYNSNGLVEFGITNDRLAELLMPLQAVLEVADKRRMEVLEEYAFDLDRIDAETESPGVRLLAACRDIFGKKRAARDGLLTTQKLISALVQRDEEPWRTWSKGQEITPEALAVLLRPFGIRSKREQRNRASIRGYYFYQFLDLWKRYLPDPGHPPGNPAISAVPATKKTRKRK